MNTICGCCFDDTLCNCLDADDLILINTSVDPYKKYYYQIIDKFENVYSGAAIVNPNGTLAIPVVDLPPGLLTQWSGSFLLQIFLDANFCERVSLPLARQYDCISLSIKGGNSTKSSIGCDFDASTLILL